MSHGRRTLALTWLLITLASLAGVATSQALLSARDDNDPAYQRPGMLDLTTAPFPAPSPVTATGRRTIVFFSRSPRCAAALAGAYAHDAVLRGEATADLVVAPSAGRGSRLMLPTLVDAGGHLASAFRLRTPRDGGAPVGYALVDSHGLVRYVTLDPEVAHNLSEVQTLVEAMP